jgi:2-dehydro-3-deoxyphosphogluconate aldolase / (4S)-4-hydroxy-2-oxoglutarate aldolase
VKPDAHCQHPSFRSKVVPVIALNDVAHAVPLAHALLEGGIDVMEITLRTAAGLPSIEAVAKAVPQMHVGAGTVTRPHEVYDVRDAGASFALSPGCANDIVAAAKEAALPFIPGVMTPSELMAARDHGFTLMKLFPAQQAGGPGMLKALAGPFPDIRFCPTGGISLANLKEHLALPNVAMVGGSWLTPAAAMQAGNWAEITQLAREALALTV